MQRKQEKKAQEQKRIRELNKLRLDVKISVDNDDGDDLGGFYLPSRDVDVHECTRDRRCRGQNRWNPP